MSAETLEAAGKLQSLFACKHFICFNSVSRCQLARWGRADDGVRVSLSLLLLLTGAARKFELENNVPITSSEFALHNSRLASEKTFCLVLLVFLVFVFCFVTRTRVVTLNSHYGHESHYVSERKAHRHPSWISRKTRF